MPKVSQEAWGQKGTLEARAESLDALANRKETGAEARKIIKEVVAGLLLGSEQLEEAARQQAAHEFMVEMKGEVS